MKKGWFALLALLLLLSGCAKKTADVQDTVYCMDTVMDLQFWGRDAKAAAEQTQTLLQQLEQEWSATGENSVVPLLEFYGNDQGLDGTVEYYEDPETGVVTEVPGNTVAMFTQQQEQVAQKALELSTRTGGAFQPQIYSLTSLWGFTTGNYTVPAPVHIEGAMGGTAWDLGGVIKGYAGMRITEQLEELDITCALLNLGGNVQTYGTKPDGSAWVIGIRDPEQENATVGNLEVHGTTSVITSGAYQRWFEADGKRYHHILDPKTGYPADSDLASVTVICTDGMTGDGLSTALFVMGYEEAVEHWRQSEDFEAVFVMNTGKVYATEGVKMVSGSYEVIKR